MDVTQSNKERRRAVNRKAAARYREECQHARDMQKLVKSTMEETDHVLTEQVQTLANYVQGLHEHVKSLDGQLAKMSDVRHRLWDMAEKVHQPPDSGDSQEVTPIDSDTQSEWENSPSDNTGSLDGSEQCRTIQNPSAASWPQSQNPVVWLPELGNFSQRSMTWTHGNDTWTAGWSNYDQPIITQEAQTASAGQSCQPDAVVTGNVPNQTNTTVADAPIPTNIGALPYGRYGMESHMW